MGGGEKVNPLYRQMVVLAVRSGAAGAARYFKPSGEGTHPPAADKRALTNVSFGRQRKVDYLYMLVASPSPPGSLATFNPFSIFKLLPSHSVPTWMVFVHTDAKTHKGKLVHATIHQRSKARKGQQRAFGRLERADTQALTGAGAESSFLFGKQPGDD